ncbi:hypothetical protein V9T40_008733 [Parthenolecanium corni]|uniref:Uncharacterized protein n=1 Tax=Parthenolecanium corni TaxID=536013 RepID=A0AAN9Y861_9HEMI
MAPETKEDFISVSENERYSRPYMYSIKSFIKFDHRGTVLEDWIDRHNHAPESEDSLQQQRLSNSLKLKAVTLMTHCDLGELSHLEFVKQVSFKFLPVA